MRPESTIESTDAPGIQALTTLARVMQHWRLLIFFPLCVAIVAAGISLVLPHRYSASATFVPEESSSSGVPASLAGIAAQFGISIPLSSSRSPEFYAALLRSRTITDRVLSRDYDIVTAGGRTSVDLVSFLEVDGEDADERLELGRRAMEDILTVGTERQTGVVRISVELSNPGLAAAVANQYLRELNDFNLYVRESVGAAKRKFVQGRRDEARILLSEAEDSLQEFNERNVRFQDSPVLMLQEARLRRAVTMAQDLYTSMAREYELARIAEVDDTPVITVLDEATIPTRRSFPRRTLLVLASGALAALIAFGLALARVKSVELTARNPEAARGLQQALRSAWLDFRSPFRKGAT